MNRHNRPGTILGTALLLLGFLVAFSSDRGAALAQATKKADKTGVPPAPEDVNYLSMEVNALRTLYLLRGSDPDASVGGQNPDERLKEFKTYSACAQKEEKKREEAKVSDAYRKTLVELRAALIADDVERIEEFDKKLQDLQKAEEPDLDDRVEITDEARKKAGLFVHNHCSADQVITYLASYGKDLPNPRTLLYNAMRVTTKKPGTFGKKATPEEWKEIRAFTIREVAWQVGGLNLKKGDRVEDRVGALLDKAYAMSDAELKKNTPFLRKQAVIIAGAVAPFDLLKTVIDQDVAEMLSNPRLIPAANARLAYLAANKKSK
jgi:hypothetical protein